MMARFACLLVICALAACGSVTRTNPEDGGPPEDAAGFDAGVPDAQPQPLPTPSRDIVGGAGRVSGATYTLDAEIGFGVSQQPTSGATYTMEGNAAVKP
jgi:hypothetical protein